MELCKGDTLFSYLEERDFEITEERASILIHKLASAIYYLHSYGIIHRDLKLDNILMTDKSDEADLKLLDFGFGKIIGPGEKCFEMVGTVVN